MKFQYTGCLIFILMVGLVACNTGGHPMSTSNRFVVLGEGGGVAGAYEQFKIRESGQVEWYDFDQKKYLPYSWLSQAKNQDFWNKIEELKIEQFKFNKPGNYSYYIELHQEKMSTTIKWSDEFQIPVEEVSIFYSSIFSHIKRMK